MEAIKLNELKFDDVEDTTEPMQSISFGDLSFLPSRSNNIGNIRKDANSFREYATPEEGIADAIGLLQREYGKKTLTEIGHKWAPPSDNNDTARWVKTVSQYSKIHPDEIPNLQHSDTVARLLYGIAKAEKSAEDMQRFDPDTVYNATRKAMQQPPLPNPSVVTPEGAGILWQIDPTAREFQKPEPDMPNALASMMSGATAGGFAGRRLAPALGPYGGAAVPAGALIGGAYGLAHSLMQLPDKGLIGDLANAGAFATEAVKFPVDVALEGIKKNPIESGKKVGSELIEMTAAPIGAAGYDELIKAWTERPFTSALIVGGARHLGKVALKPLLVKGSIHALDSKFKGQLKDYYKLTADEADMAVSHLKGEWPELTPAIQEKIATKVSADGLPVGTVEGFSTELQAAYKSFMEARKALKEKPQAVTPEQESAIESDISIMKAKAQADLKAAAVAAKAAKTEKALKSYEGHTFATEEGRAKAIAKASEKYGVELESYEVDGKLRVRRKTVVEEAPPIVEAEAPVETPVVSEEGVSAVPEAVPTAEMSLADLLEQGKLDYKLEKKSLPLTDADRQYLAEGREAAAKWRNQRAAKKAAKAKQQELDLQEAARKSAGTGRDSIIETAEGKKTQGEVDLGMVDSMKQELAARKAAKAAKEHESVQSSNTLPPAPKGVSKPIYEAMQQGSFIRKNADKSGWVIDIGGKETKVPEKTLQALNVKGIVEFNVEADRFELKGQKASTTVKKTTSVAETVPAADALPVDDTPFPSYKSARDAARAKAEETQMPWIPEEQIDGSYRIKARPREELGAIIFHPGEFGHLIDKIKKGVEDVKEKFKKPFNLPNIKSQGYLKAVQTNAHWFAKKLAWDQEALFALQDMQKLPEYDRNMFLAQNAGIAPKGYVMDPATKAYYDSTKQLMAAFRVEFQKYGRLENFVKDYMPLVVKADPKGNPFNPAQPLMRRKFKDPMEAMTHLVAEGYQIETDAAAFIPQYISWAGNKLAGLEAMEIYKNIPAPDGLPSIRPVGMLPRDAALKADFIPARYESKLRRMNSPTKYADPAVEKAMKDIGRDEIYIHKDIFQDVDSMFTDPSEGFLKGLGIAQSTVKQIVMYNPLFHSWNVASNFVPSSGFWDTAKVLTGKHKALERIKTPEGFREVLREMAVAGVRNEGVYNVRRALQQDQYTSRLDHPATSIKDILQSPTHVLTHLPSTVHDLNTYIVFDKMVKGAQVSHYLIKKQAYMDGYRDPLKGFQKQPGLPEAEAARLAALDTNATVGSIPPFHFTRSQRTYLRFLMFARDWNVGTARQLIGTSEWLSQKQGLPRFLRTEGLTKNEWLNLKAANRSYVLRAVVGAYATANMMQHAFMAVNGKEPRPTWENESGHWLDIDTGLDDNDGKPIYLRNPMFRQVDEYFRLYKMEEGPFKLAMQKAEPVVSTTARLFMNKSARPGENAIYGQEAGYEGWRDPESLAAMAKEILAIMPFDDIYGDPYRIRTSIEKWAMAFGTSTRRGISRNVEESDYMKEAFRYVGKHERLSKMAMKELNMMFQEGKNIDEAMDKAVEYIENGLMTEGQFRSVVKGRAVPMFQRFLTGPRGEDFLRSLPEKKRQELMEFMDRNY